MRLFVSVGADVIKMFWLLPLLVAELCTPSVPLLLGV